MSGDFDEFQVTRLRGKCDRMANMVETLIAELEGYMSADHREKCGGSSDLEDHGFATCKHEICVGRRRYLGTLGDRLEEVWGGDGAAEPPTAATAVAPKRQGSSLIRDWPSNGQVVKVAFTEERELVGWFLGFSIERIDKEIHTCDKVTLTLILPDDPADADRHFRDRVHELEARRDGKA